MVSGISSGSADSANALEETVAILKTEYFPPRGDHLLKVQGVEVEGNDAVALHVQVGVEELGVEVQAGALLGGVVWPEVRVQDARARLGVELDGQAGAGDADDLLVGLTDRGLDHCLLLLSGDITHRK